MIPYDELNEQSLYISLVIRFAFKLNSNENYL